MAVSVVSFSFSRAAQPEAQRPTLLGNGFLYCILSATSLDPNSSGAPRAPSAKRGFLYHILSSNSSNLQRALTVLTELYDSSTPTQSPTQSLEWHVWSSSSGNNCHAVQRSLSSGVSVYECIMGFFTLSHFVSQFQPTRFPLITAIVMCHFLPVHHFEWLERVEGHNTTLTLGHVDINFLILALYNVLSLLLRFSLGNSIGVFSFDSTYLLLDYFK